MFGNVSSIKLERVLCSYFWEKCDSNAPLIDDTFTRFAEGPSLGAGRYFLVSQLRSCLYSMLKILEVDLNLVYQCWPIYTACSCALFIVHCGYDVHYIVTIFIHYGLLIMT